MTDQREEYDILAYLVNEKTIKCFESILLDMLIELIDFDDLDEHKEIIEGLVLS